MTDELQQKTVETDAAHVAGAPEASPAASEIDPALLEEMARTGVLYGRKKSKTYPTMRRYIHTTRNGVEIFDPTQTLEQLARATEFLKELAKRGGLLMLVGVQPAARDLLREAGERWGFPYVTTRWLGGTLTNFKTISGRIQHYVNLKADRAAGKLEKYTKKERVIFDRDIRRMEMLFGGLERLSRVPDALFIVDPAKHETAMREARRLGVPRVALVSSDSNPELVTHPVPCNASARQSIAWIFTRLCAGLEEGRKEYETIKAAPTTSSEPLATSH